MTKDDYRTRTFVMPSSIKDILTEAKITPQGMVMASRVVPENEIWVVDVEKLKESVSRHKITPSSTG